MARQLDMFGKPPAPPSRAEVGAAPVPEELRETASRLPTELRMGTSSWSFPGWEGLVYDRAASKSRLARKGLAAYAQHPLLRAVGIDRTFYAPIATEDFAAYAADVPDDFRFLVKAPALCTTPRLRQPGVIGDEPNELFLDPSFAAQEAVGPFVEGLGSKAGALVFQFPPIGAGLRREPDRFAEMLGEFLGALPEGPLYAVELRDPELLVEAYARALQSARTRHCYTIHPRMPSLAEQRRVVGTEVDGPLVARWMLGAGLGYEEAVRRYEPFSRLVDEDLANRDQLAGMAAEHLAFARPVIITANNKAEGSAPISVFRLAHTIAGRLGR